MESNKTRKRSNSLVSASKKQPKKTRRRRKSLHTRTPIHTNENKSEEQATTVETVSNQQNDQITVAPETTNESPSESATPTNQAEKKPSNWLEKLISGFDATSDFASMGSKISNFGKSDDKNQADEEKESSNGFLDYLKGGSDIMSGGLGAYQGFQNMKSVDSEGKKRSIGDRISGGVGMLSGVGKMAGSVFGMLEKAGVGGDFVKNSNAMLGIANDGLGGIGKIASLFKSNTNDE